MSVTLSLTDDEGLVLFEWLRPRAGESAHVASLLRATCSGTSSKRDAASPSLARFGRGGGRPTESQQEQHPQHTHARTAPMVSTQRATNPPTSAFPAWRGTRGCR